MEKRRIEMTVEHTWFARLGVDVDGSIFRFFNERGTKAKDISLIKGSEHAYSISKCQTIGRYGSRGGGRAPRAEVHAHVSLSAS